MKNQKHFTLIAVALMTAFGSAHALDSFDPASNQLTLASVTLDGGPVYNNVTATIAGYTMIGVDGGAPLTDTFESRTGMLRMGSVSVDGTTYTNVRVQLNSYTLLSATPATASNYSGEAAAAFSRINQERNQCGFGLLAQNASIDAAATAHANYSYGPGDAHTETPGRSGFTGVHSWDRMLSKGYPGLSYGGGMGEVMSYGRGDYAVRLLLSGPYHLSAMVGSYRDIGFGYQSNAQIPDVALLVVDLGSTAAVGPHLMGAGEIKTYPCDGATGVNRQLKGETPNPVPGRDLNTSPIGTPVFVQARDGQTLNITASAMTKVSTGAQVAMRMPTVSTNDPNRLLAKNTGYVAPDAALEANTQYRVTVTGTNNGSPFTRTFTFTTGS